MPDQKLFGKNLNLDTRRRLRLAAAYLGMTQNEFIARAIEESIKLHNVPDAILQARPIEVTNASGQ